ncbi:spore germination protein [Priestia megaterium]
MGSLTETVNIEDAMHQVLTGCVILLVDGLKEILVMDVKGFKTRTIEEPITEGLVRGPRVGFLENIRDNTAILRRLSTDNHLTFCDYDVGKRTKRKLVVAYIDGIANDQLVQEVKNELNKST